MSRESNGLPTRSPVRRRARSTDRRPSDGPLGRVVEQAVTPTVERPPERSAGRTTRTLFVSTYPPEECGLATFTKDAADAVDGAMERPRSTIMAIRRDASVRYSDPRVRHVIDDGGEKAFRRAGEDANSDPCDVVSIQHEFGLYGGTWGASILEFAAACRKPIVTTFHTLMQAPEAVPKIIVQRLAALSSSVVVMTKAAAKLLAEDFGVTATPVEIIPHGVPLVARATDDACKALLGLTNQRVLCTFGLIGRGKGLDHMIEAMPRVVTACPNALYLIVGVTHPLVKRAEGERYRESLMARAAALGVSEHVRFVNRFLELPELLTYLGACDVYVTPYPSRNQIASGTLAYAMAAGRAVVSTPYIYAEEVLADGRGILVPFASSDGLAEATCRLLHDEPLRADIRSRAYDYSKPMRWPVVGRDYLRCFETAVADHRARHAAWVSSQALLATELPRPTGVS